MTPADDGALFFPVADGDLASVRLLVKHGARPNASMEGMRPIEWAAHYAQDDVYEWLIGWGVPPLSDAVRAQLRLIGAAKEGDIGAITQALNDGADINGTDPRGQSALVAALTFGSGRAQELATTVGTLLGLGAEPDGRGMGMGDLAGIPIHVAARFCPPSDPAAEDARADRADDRVEIVRRIVEAGAEPCVADDQGRTALHYMAECNNVEGVALLLSSGCPADQQDSNGQTPLEVAGGPEVRAVLREALLGR